MTTIQPRRFIRRALALPAAGLAALSLGSCVGSFHYFDQYECTVEISPTAVPDARMRVSNRDLRFRDERGDPLADYFTCLDGETFYSKDVCEECAVSFHRYYNPGDGSPMEDHWGHLVAGQVAALGRVADPSDPGEVGFEFARYSDWCVHPETLDCELITERDPGPIPCVTEEIADTGLAPCPAVPPPAADLIVGCDPGVPDGCSLAVLETPLGGTTSLEIHLTHGGGAGDPEIAIDDIALTPLGNTGPGELVLRDVAGEPSCDPSFPDRDGVHLLSVPAVYPEGSSCAIGLDFTPSDPLPRSAQLAFTAAGAEQVIAIEGRGVPGELEATPASVCLQNVLEECTDSVVVQITNDGPGNVTAFGVALTEADPAIPNFEFVPNVVPDLGAGVLLAPRTGGLEVEVRSCRSPEPGDVQDTVGTLVIANDNTEAGSLVVPLVVESDCPSG